MSSSLLTEDEQLARALQASLAEQDSNRSRQRYVARTDEEEQEALSLAVAASLAEHEDAQQGALYPPIHAQQPSRPSNPQQQQQQQRRGYSPPQAYGPPNSHTQQPPPVYPSAPPAGPQQQQQLRPPASAGGTNGTAGSSSSSGREWWSRPLQLLDAAVQKVDSAMQGVAKDLGGSSMGCAGCGRGLGFGPVLNALGKSWHPGCFRCAGCQAPIDMGGVNMTFAVGQDGQPYHQQCRRELFDPKCSVCGDLIPMRGDGRIEWHANPFWKNNHCPSHSVDGTPQCCSCSRLKPIAEEWVSLQDGRLLCLECLDTLVVDTKEAQPLYEEVLQFFTFMGMPHPYKAPLLLVEGPVLEDYADREGRPRQPGSSGPVFHIRGLCVAHVYTTIPSVVRTLGGAGAVSSISTALAPLLGQPQQHCTVSVLLVMYGLPRLLIGSIVAHELMHAYLRMRHVAGLPLQVEEGLCQLMAMLWLDSQDHWAKQHSNPYQQRLLSYLGFQIRTDTSEVYGEGFRIALEKFQQRGLRALVEHVIQHGRWPEWTA